MAPLTLTEKYNDLVRCADQPVSSYDKLTNEDLEDVIGKMWPFIIESISSIPSPSDKDDSVTEPPIFNSEIRTNLERRLKIQFPLYSEAARRCQQRFPNRKPVKRQRNYSNAYLTETGSLSLETSSTFSLDHMSDIDVPSFYVFCSAEQSSKQGPKPRKQLSSVASAKQRQADYDRAIKYLSTSIQTSPYGMVVFKQALKECCRCGTYHQLKSLCLVADLSIETIYFDNNDTVLHESIKLNNKQLTSELIRFRFDINVNGELGTPLITAVHYHILWAVELLLNHEADLTQRHIDWPFLTLYEYCIQFAKIDIKLMIDKHITSLIHQRKYTTLRKLIDNGWNISRKKRTHIYNMNPIK